jgi:hypothetical protein
MRKQLRADFYQRQHLVDRTGSNRLSPHMLGDLILR